MKLFNRKRRVLGRFLDGTKITKKDIKSGANLKYADLSGADLGKANLRGADLRWANLCGADLRWADLSEADLGGVDLFKADLCRANLNEANLREADLRGANLSGADLCGANLREASLCGANLRDADLKDTILDFSCFPLGYGSFDMKADDRLVYQLVCHLTHLAQDNMSDDAKEAIKTLDKWKSKFCEYKDDIKKTEDVLNAAKLWVAKGEKPKYDGGDE